MVQDPYGAGAAGPSWIISECQNEKKSSNKLEHKCLATLEHTCVPVLLGTGQYCQCF